MAPPREHHRCGCHQQPLHISGQGQLACSSDVSSYHSDKRRNFSRWPGGGKTGLTSILNLWGTSRWALPLQQIWYCTESNKTNLKVHCKPRTMTLAVGLLLFIITSNLLPLCRFIGYAQQYREDPFTFKVADGPFTWLISGFGNISQAPWPLREML